MKKNNSKFKLSWKKINLFFQCQHCFYKEQVLGLKRPGIDADSFSLNNAVDALWKNEFDQYRQQEKPHPIMIANNIDAIPFSNKLIYLWRDYQAGGIRSIDRVNSLELYGIVDDVWINSNQELIIVDYKATAKHKSLTSSTHKNKWIENNEKQIAFYANIFRKNGYKVHDTGYFVFSTALHNQSFFNQRLDFETTVQSYKIDDAWIDQSLQDIRNCLDQNNTPEPSIDCEFCKYNLTKGHIENI